MIEIFLFQVSTSTIGVLLIGFYLGLLHAIEADHLAAVSTIVTERRSLLSAALVGGVWGLGHTISLFAAGVLVLLLDFKITEQTERILETGVGVMLVLLGLNVWRKLVAGGELHFHQHAHDRHAHAHPHVHEAGKSDQSNTHHGLSFSPRALIVGMVHGLAGSAALMLLVIPTIDSRQTGLLYILIFGAGSIGGMMLMSFLVSLPLHLTANKLTNYNLALRCLAGLFSIGLGLFIIYEKTSEGLFS